MASSSNDSSQIAKDVAKDELIKKCSSLFFHKYCDMNKDTDSPITKSKKAKDYATALANLFDYENSSVSIIESALKENFENLSNTLKEELEELKVISTVISELPASLSDNYSKIETAISNIKLGNNTSMGTAKDTGGGSTSAGTGSGYSGQGTGTGSGYGTGYGYGYGYGTIGNSNYGKGSNTSNASSNIESLYNYVNSSVQSLQSQINNIQTTIAQLKNSSGDTNSVTSQINSLKSQITEIQSTINSLKNNSGSSSSSTSADVVSQITSLQNQINDLSSIVVSLKNSSGNSGSSSGTSTEVTSQITLLQNQVNNLQNAVTAIQSNISSQGSSSDIVSLRNTVGTIQTQINSLIDALNSGTTVNIDERSFEEFVSSPNAEYTLYKTYDLGNKTITLPDNVTLVFKRGAGISNGTLVGSNSVIVASSKIFVNVNIKGTWNCVGDIRWFANGCKVLPITGSSNNSYTINNRIDESAELQLALDSSFRELDFPPVPYYITNTITLKKEKKIVIHGNEMRFGLDQYVPCMENAGIIFSDQNITLLRISVYENSQWCQQEVTINGGNFDVSLCNNYTASCIEVLADNNQKLWGLNINTNVKGKYNSTTGVGIDLNPIENQAAAGNNAYVTQIRINSDIAHFGIGLRATNYMDTSTATYYNWCTDLVVDGSIINCPLCIETNVDCDIKAMLQAGYFFDTKENGAALIRYTGIAASISSNIFDITLQGEGGKYANQYALETTNTSAKVVPYGRFNAFLIEARWTQKPVVKGILYNNVTERIVDSVA